MRIYSGQYVVLEDDGAVAVYDGVDYLGDIKSAPPNLKTQDGSFVLFVNALAGKYELSVKPMPEWPHCFGLE